ncbi:putative protein C20orf85 [Turdus rufiventris]|nr:putative protein C20orf85 [Turdus rufiventris]
MDRDNFVAQDNYWKDQIAKEADAAKRWAEKWEFLKTPLEELIGDEKKEDAKPKLQLPDHLQIRPVTPVEKYIKDSKGGEISPAAVSVESQSHEGVGALTNPALISCSTSVQSLVHIGAVSISPQNWEEEKG